MNSEDDDRDRRDDRNRDRDRDRDRPRGRDRDDDDRGRVAAAMTTTTTIDPDAAVRDDDYDRPRKSGSSTLIIVLVVVGLVVAGFIAIAYFAFQKVGEAKLRIRSQNNLKQFAVAMHNHEGATGHFPAPAICDKEGKPLLSWRVAILPYIEQGALYNQFKLDEPWDSPNNKKLLSSMPKIYEPVDNQAVADEYKTYYRVFYPKGEIGFGPRENDLPKGTSGTVMIVEAGEPVFWTKPDELEYEEGKPLPSLGGVLPNVKSFHVAMFDGSVRAIKREEAETIKDMIRTKNVRFGK